MTAVGVAIYGLGMHRLVIWLRRSRLRVLVYHAIAHEEEGVLADLGAVTSPEVFARHLAYLQQYYRPVSLATVESGRLPRYAALITFDDGYQSVYRHAYPLLRRQGVPAALYVVPTVVGNRGLLWPNALAWLLARHGDIVRPLVTRRTGLPVGTTPIGRVVDAVRARFEPAMVTSLLAEAWATVGTTAAAVAQGDDVYVSWEEVEEMAEGGIAIGSHTVSHPNLARLAPEGQRRELAESKAHITGRLGACTSLAYPFGDFDSATARIGAEVGYRSLMEVGGRSGPFEALAVGRVPVTATTHAGLFAEIEVVAPLKARLRRWLDRPAPRPDATGG